MDTKQEAWISEMAKWLYPECCEPSDGINAAREAAEAAYELYGETMTPFELHMRWDEFQGEINKQVIINVTGRRTLVFEGKSDDTFGEFSVFNRQHDNCADGKPIRWRLFDVDTNDEMIVFGEYAVCERGSWMIGVSPSVDHQSIPDWTMRLGRSDHDYSPRLEIDAPISVQMELVEEF